MFHFPQIPFPPGYNLCYSLWGKWCPLITRKAFYKRLLQQLHGAHYQIKFLPTCWAFPSCCINTTSTTRQKLDIFERPYVWTLNAGRKFMLCIYKCACEELRKILLFQTNVWKCIGCYIWGLETTADQGCIYEPYCWKTLKPVRKHRHCEEQYFSFAVPMLFL